MPSPYSTESRALQDRFDTRRLADRLAKVTVHDRFTESDRAFIEARDMFFLATVDAAGHPTCSYKGGDPGFVTVVDERVERSRHVPRGVTPPPVPGWKRAGWAADVLPADDPARGGPEGSQGPEPG